jgi:phage antirepressor YoqD-like protein
MPAAKTAGKKKRPGARKHNRAFQTSKAIMQLITQTSNLTMSSREMAGLVEKRHDSVKRTIETLAANGLISQPQIVDGEKAANGVVEALYLVGKRDSYVVVAQLSPAFTARIVDRWQELESQQVPKPAELSRMDILQLALDAEHGRIKAEAALAIAAPKAQALDRIAGADGSLCLRDAAKQLQVKPKHFNLWLQANKWIYKRAGCSNYIGYQDRIQSGLIEHKASIVIDGAGNERMRDQARITAKGIARLAEVFAQEVAA